MADTILSLEQVEDLFQRLTLQLLGLDPGASKNQGRVRIAWPSNGAPSWKREEDIAFIMLGYDDDSITQQQEVTYQNNDPTSLNSEVSYTQVIRVNWICYGPNSYGDAGKIRSSLYSPSNVELLAKSNLALILNVGMPMRSPELFNGQWWDRTSFYARFNELVIRRSTVPTIQIGDIQIVKG